VAATLSVAQALTSVREIEREISSLRSTPGSDAPYQRTSVMTHMAWVPEEWVEAAEDVLSGLAERHPSRTLVLVPEPDAEDGLEASVEVHCFPVGEGRQICTETIRIRLNGQATTAPESVVQPLFLPDLPVFLRWRGTPAFGERPFERLLDVIDRLIVDSTEWPELRRGYERLTGLFDRVVVSDIAWARTSRWRAQLATLWPGIADVHRIRVVGTAAQAQLLGGWLRSRLERAVQVDHEPADKLLAVDVDGEPTPFPPGDAPNPSDLLSEELDRFTRDQIYEDAVRAAAHT
jgi:Glucose-6-phosphate dehydrogenase subunit